MANITQLYRDNIDPKPPPAAKAEADKLKAEQDNVLKWEEWRGLAVTKEFLKILEGARNELLIGTNTGKEMTIGLPDALLYNPAIPTDFIKIRLAEIGTLQKVLRTTLDGKYNK